MKFTFATACLLGYTSAGHWDYDNQKPAGFPFSSPSFYTHPDEKVWTLRSVIDHRSDQKLQIDFGNQATSRADARPPLRSNLQIEAEESSSSSDSSSSKSSSSSSSSDDKKSKKIQLTAQDDEVDHSGEFFKSSEHDKLGGGGYSRVTTAHFAADDDDLFMRSMIQQYALEGKNKDGSPNGQFWMDEANALAASREVLETHKNLKGAERDEYLKTYFPRTWAHFDVNKTGKIEVIKMPQFMRFLASDQTMQLQ